MDKYITIIVDNAYIALWLYILISSLTGKSTIKMFKYKQRTLPFDLNDKESEKKAKEEYKNLKNEIFVYEKYIKLTTIITGILSPVLIFLHFYFGYFIICIEFFPLIFTIAIFMLTIKPYTISKFCRNFLWIIDFIYFILIYGYYCYGKSYFIDVLVVIITVLVFIISKKYKYENRITVILLGLNLLFLNEKYLDFDMYRIYYNIILSISTGILASGIIMMFSDHENKVKNKKVREYHLDNISGSINILLETIFDYMYIEDKSKYFDYVVYDEFKKDYETLCNSGHDNIEKTFEDHIVSSLKWCANEIKEVLKHRSNLEINLTIDYFETIALQEFLYYSEECVSAFRDFDMTKYEKDIAKLFFKIEQLSGEINEIKDMLEQIGKEKLEVHMEVGTLRYVWSDGTKITTEEFIEYEKNKKR